MAQDLVLPRFESDTVEFKEKWSESSKKAISAFLNSSGGTVYFGVNDEGQVVGIEKEDVDKLLNTISLVTRQGFRPAADALVRSRVCEVEGRWVVATTVLAGTELPYYATLKGEGTRAYIRRGPACFEITDSERRDLIRRSETRDWDVLPSALQNLTFEAAKRMFDEQGIEFSERKYALLGLIDSNGFYTNLALLLSDQCPAQTRVGFFEGTERGVASSGIETLTGSILKQMQQALKLLSESQRQDLGIRAFTVAADGTRVEDEDYPAKAVREAIVNAFAHRDYSLDLQAFVSMFSDRMEVFTFGGLPKGVLASQLEEGASACRNGKLADLLMRLGYMERYGLGIPSIFASYKPYGLKPRIQVDPNRIVMVLPKLAKRPAGLTNDQTKIWNLLQQGTGSRAAIQKLLGWSMSKTTILLNQLLGRDLIERLGSGRNTKYRIKERA